MIVRQTIWGMVLLLMAIVVHPTQAQTIAISPKSPADISLSSSNVQVGDIFDVTPSSSSLGVEVKALGIVQIRTPGEEQQIYHYQVKNRLNQSGLGHHVEIRGEFPILVKSMEKILPSKELHAIIDEYFQGSTDAANARSIHWEFIREPEIKYFPADDVSIEFPSQRKIQPGRFALQGKLINGNYHKSVSFLLNVKITRNVYISTRAIPRGEVLTQSNISVEPRALDVRESRYAAQNLTLSGHTEARRNIKAGEILLSTMIKKQDIIHSGETVRLVLEYGNIRVQSYGKAIESGALAEVIRVRDRESGKILQGKVLNNQTIQIEPLRNL